MLHLSELLLKHSDDIESFTQLTEKIQQEAVATREIYFNLDIEPPAYSDRPDDWYEKLEIAFSSAR